MGILPPNSTKINDVDILPPDSTKINDVGILPPDSTKINDVGILPPDSTKINDVGILPPNSTKINDALNGALLSSLHICPPKSPDSLTLSAPYFFHPSFFICWRL